MKRLAGVLAGVVVLCSAAAAHHGYDDFFREKRVSVEGVLEELHYANPHVILKIRTDDGQLYTALWEGLTGVERRGGDRSTLRVGERVMVIGSPPRSGVAEHRTLAAGQASARRLDVAHGVEA